MARPSKLDKAVVDSWLSQNAGWAREAGDAEALARAFRFPDFGAALAFAVQVGMLAEKRDHHPDILIGWGKARVSWSTHDAGGITQLDLDLAEATARLAGG
jgi:4a-hydroxytetrahydrobiopterin dehydratase